MDKLNLDLKSPTFPRTEFNKLDITTLRGALTGATNDGTIATSPTQEWVDATTERVDAFLAAHAPSASLSSIALGFYHYFQPTLEQACKAIVENSFNFQHDCTTDRTTDNTTIEGTINGDTIDPGLEEAEDEEADEEENQHQSMLELASLAEMDVLSIKETADGIVVVDVVVDLGENTDNVDSDVGVDSDESDATIKVEVAPENTLSEYPTFHSYFLNIVLEHAKSIGLTDDEASTRLKYHTRSTQELERHTTTERHLLLQQIASIAASTPLRDVFDFASIRKLKSLHAETDQLFTAVRSVILWDYLDCFFGEDSRIFCFNCFGQYINTEGGLIANRVEI